MSPEMQALRTQSTEFSAQGAAFRRELVAEPATYAGRALCVAFSAVRSRREIEAGGFEVMPDFIGRVDKSAYPWFTPAKGAIILIGSARYKITEIANIRLGNEWFFALGKP